MNGNPLIEDLRKDLIPDQQFYYEENILHVDATASVPVEISFRGVEKEGRVGVDIVFMIDNSGTMDSSDPEKVRYTAIQQLAGEFKLDRNHLDRVSIVTFSGDPDGDETEVWMTWRTWSETENYVANMDDHPPEEGTFTPMALGMQFANALLEGSDRFYKIVVMLTDGVPESFGNRPDQEQEYEIESVHIPFAKINQILYSPILLGAEDEEGSSILFLIAEGTDYITDPPEDPPRYYFNTSNVDQIESKYRLLFEDVFDRIVPKRVLFREKVNSLLRVENPSFTLDGISPNDIHPSTPLSDGLESFEGTGGYFQVLIQELCGTAVLKFNVRLNFDFLTDQQLALDYIEVPVDLEDTEFSSIQYDYPLESGYVTLFPFSLPQATIRFLTGVRVSKKLLDPQNFSLGEPHEIQIDMANISLTDLPWFWIKEFPSFYVDTFDVQDDYAFSPLTMIAEYLFPPLSRQLIVRPEDMNPGLFINLLKTYYRISVDHYLEEIDPYLCRFRFTFDQSGIFKYTRRVLSRDTRKLSMKVRGATYGQATQLNRPVDNPAEKPPESSRYRFPGVENWKYLEPNPDFSQIRLPGSCPELTVRTCFDRDVDRFFEALVGIRQLPAYYRLEGLSEIESLLALLDSSDINPTGLWYSDIGEQLGIQVTVHNRGTCTGSSTIHVKSIFLPLPSPELNMDAWPHIHVPTMECKAEGSVTVAGREPNNNQIPSTTITILYETMHRSDGSLVNVDQDVAREFSGFMINVVELDPAEGIGDNARTELLLANNKAIEIVRVISPDYDVDSWLQDLHEAMRETYESFAERFERRYREYPR